jgi:hypothetical protein
VSVVDAREAAEAAAAGADVIDAKDPSRGALGPVSSGALAAILEACPPGAETSAALGELSEMPAGPPRGAGTAPAAAARTGPTYVKAGLAGQRDAGLALRRARQTGLDWAGCGSKLILVAYADHQRAGAPAPDEVPALALEAGAGGCLLDTAIKDGACLLDWMREAALSGFIEACRRRGLLCALAGSLRAEHLPRVAALGPDLIGVRGAACDGDRVRGRLSPKRVAALVGALGRMPPV